MNLDQFDYNLPSALVAQFPLQHRTDSRLLGFDRNLNQCRESPFSQISSFLQPGDLVVVNDSRVLPARVHARKPSGGKVEVLLERLLGSDTALVQLRANKSVKSGQVLCLGNYRTTVIERRGRFFMIRFADHIDAERVFRECGSIPLPPYIQREPLAEDDERYQTVYSQVPGAVAAPTAGLHFDRQLIRQLNASGILWQTVTLHVGAGTFLPMQSENIADHVMHQERIIVSKETCDQINQVKAAGGRVIAIGTTVVRALETAALSGSITPCDGESDLFITPGFKFKIVDVLVTNFHLPKSTLLVLVSAFAGYHRVMKMYQYAIENRFRFFSYGDAMLLEKNDEV